MLTLLCVHLDLLSVCVCSNVGISTVDGGFNRKKKMKVDEGILQQLHIKLVVTMKRRCISHMVHLS